MKFAEHTRLNISPFGTRGIPHTSNIAEHSGTAFGLGTAALARLSTDTVLKIWHMQACISHTTRGPNHLRYSAEDLKRFYKQKIIVHLFSSEYKIPYDSVEGL